MISDRNLYYRALLLWSNGWANEANETVNRIRDDRIRGCTIAILRERVFEIGPSNFEAARLRQLPLRVAAGQLPLIPDKDVRADLARELFNRALYSDHELAVQLMGTFPTTEDDDFRSFIPTSEELATF